jgi:hypothetical protein
MILRWPSTPRYRWAFIAQLLVSSTFGLFILVLAASDSLPGLLPATIPPTPLLAENDNYYTLVFYSFLVGLSEPNTLRRAVDDRRRAGLNLPASATRQK